jgi:hypothetical protein
MRIWENAWGEEFETEEDARDNVSERMEWYDYERLMEKSISWSQLFNWARKQEGFFETFENEFCEAENDFFDENYSIVDNDEEDEE